LHHRDIALETVFVRGQRVVAMMKAYPELKLGPPTARWLIEAFRKMDRVTSPYHLFSITITTIVIATTRDGVVPYTAQERLSRYFR
ncbi:alpha/beta hydrolase, partial [Rhizobium ruizarguesonis]